MKIRHETLGFVEMKVDGLRGKSVRLRHDVANGSMSIAAGTVVRVTGTWRSGVNIEGPRCVGCGVSLRMTRVERNSIEIVDAEVPRV